MIGKLNKVKDQRGFSMAEVVVAVTLFVASILGVSVMLVSGGANVTSGAKDRPYGRSSLMQGPARLVDAVTASDRVC
jgi:hypothetical protein